MMESFTTSALVKLTNKATIVTTITDISFSRYSAWTDISVSDLDIILCENIYRLLLVLPERKVRNCDSLFLPASPSSVNPCLMLENLSFCGCILRVTPAAMSILPIMGMDINAACTSFKKTPPYIRLNIRMITSDRTENPIT